MEKTKKILSMVLCIVMVLCSVPLGNFAGLDLSSLTMRASALSESGQCGKNVNWSFDSSTGKLTISGSGEMNDYSYYTSPFYRNTSIKSVIIEDGVTSIGSYAFEYCSSITSTTIPNSVTSIGNSAFGDCGSLTSITIPDSVTSMGGNAFGNCSSLTSVTIGNGVTSLEFGVFFGCRSLSNVGLVTA